MTVILRRMETITVRMTHNKYIYQIKQCTISNKLWIRLNNKTYSWIIRTYSRNVKIKSSMFILFNVESVIWREAKKKIKWSTAIRRISTEKIIIKDCKKAIEYLKREINTIRNTEIK